MGRINLEEDCYSLVTKTIKKYNLIEEGDRLVIGVSGGPDSICLLDILRKIKETNLKNENLKKSAVKIPKFDFVVAHINHMIRKEAKQDEEFVKKYCEKNNIEFYCKSIDIIKIANNNKISTEEAGRNARYQFFDEVLEKTNSNKIVIAHNKNDKVETIIMNELRGCGILGLKGIEAKRGKYIRPLIEVERKIVEKYCTENNLDPRIDKTNFENIYTRNKIRNIIIPYIEKEFNPNIINTMDRLSNIVIEQEEYIEKQVEKIYTQILIEENKSENVVINLKGFNQQEKVIKSHLILYIITRLFDSSKNIERVHIEDIIKLCENNIGNKFLCPNKNLKVFVKNGEVKFIKQM